MKRNDAKHYLQRPYARIVIPDGEGSYHAEILEFPGCYAQGKSPEDAYKNLEGAAQAWIQACLDKGQPIPEPSSSLGYGGNILLRLPRSIHRQAAKMAERDRSSLNTYLVSAVAAKIGAEDFYCLLAQRLEHQLSMTVADLARAFNIWATGQTSSRAQIRTGGVQIENTATTNDQQSTIALR